MARVWYIISIQPHQTPQLMSHYSRRQLYNKVFVRHRSLKDGLLNEEVRFSTMIKLRHLLFVQEKLDSMKDWSFKTGIQLLLNEINRFEIFIAK